MLGHEVKILDSPVTSDQALVAELTDLPSLHRQRPLVHLHQNFRKDELTPTFQPLERPLPTRLTHHPRSMFSLKPTIYHPGPPTPNRPSPCPGSDIFTPAEGNHTYHTITTLLIASQWSAANGKPILASLRSVEDVRGQSNRQSMVWSESLALIIFE